jgi:hypothetical protein
MCVCKLDPWCGLQKAFVHLSQNILIGLTQGINLIKHLIKLTPFCKLDHFIAEKQLIPVLENALAYKK